MTGATWRLLPIEYEIDGVGGWGNHPSPVRPYQGPLVIVAFRITRVQRQHAGLLVPDSPHCHYRPSPIVQTTRRIVWMLADHRRPFPAFFGTWARKLLRQAHAPRQDSREPGNRYTSPRYPNHTARARKRAGHHLPSQRNPEALREGHTEVAGVGGPYAGRKGIRDILARHVSRPPSPKWDGTDITTCLRSLRTYV